MFCLLTSGSGLTKIDYCGSMLGEKVGMKGGKEMDGLAKFMIALQQVKKFFIQKSTKIWGKKNVAINRSGNKAAKEQPEKQDFNFIMGCSFAGACDQPYKQLSCI